MIITTSARTNDRMIDKARMLAAELDADYVTRRKHSVEALQESRKEDCIVVGKNRLELFQYGEQEPFFFHPSSAMFRIKRLARGEADPLVEAADLKRGKTLLDCTMGLASDSIIASFTVGAEGKVTSLEGNKYISYIVKEGLAQWDSGLEEMDDAMRRIEVQTCLSLSFLQALPDNSYHCVYFDPMFEESIEESEGISALKKFAVYDDLTAEMMKEAVRVAQERVVLKDHFRSERFEKYGFSVKKRKSAKFHFGVIDKQEIMQRGR